VSATIVAQGHARPWHDAGEVHAAMRQIEKRAAGTRFGGTAWLFRQVDDPDVLLLVADWDISPGLGHSAGTIDGTPTFDALCVGDIQRSVFRRRSVAELSWKTAVIDCTIVRAPSAARGVVQAVSEQVLNPAVSALPGFVLRHSYQDVDNPDRFLTVEGWDSAAAMESFLHHMAPRLTKSLSRLGATVERFVGQAPV
jgi:quinol monooxygenase YgiN